MKTAFVDQFLVSKVEGTAVFPMSNTVHIKSSSASTSGPSSYLLHLWIVHCYCPHLHQIHLRPQSPPDQNHPHQTTYVSVYPAPAHLPSPDQSSLPVPVRGNTLTSVLTNSNSHLLRLLTDNTV